MLILLDTIVIYIYIYIYIYNYCLKFLYVIFINKTLNNLYPFSISRFSRFSVTTSRKPVMRVRMSIVFGSDGRDISLNVFRTDPRMGCDDDDRWSHILQESLPATKKLDLRRKPHL